MPTLLASFKNCCSYRHEHQSKTQNACKYHHISPTFNLVNHISMVGSTLFPTMAISKRQAAAATAVMATAARATNTATTNNGDKTKENRHIWQQKYSQTRRRASRPNPRPYMALWHPTNDWVRTVIPSVLCFSVMRTFAIKRHSELFRGTWVGCFLVLVLLHLLAVGVVVCWFFHLPYLSACCHRFAEFKNELQPASQCVVFDGCPEDETEIFYFFCI